MIERARRAAEYNVFRKICLKYTLMKIRMKISYIAFEKGCTITELFLNAIMKSHQEL